MKFYQRCFAVIVVSGMMIIPDLALAAGKCTRSDLRQISAAISRVEAAERRFDNSKIKDFCRAGRRFVSELKRAVGTFKSRPQCTLATSSDRRSVARLDKLVRHAEREMNKGC